MNEKVERQRARQQEQIEQTYHLPAIQQKVVGELVLALLTAGIPLTNESLRQSLRDMSENGATPQQQRQATVLLDKLAGLEGALP